MAETEWIDLFNGTDLSGWTLRNGGPNGWSVEPNGVYRSEKPSADLLTEREFEDFELHVEFNMPPKSNSGVYLRGMFEIQVINHREEMTGQACGALYKRHVPIVNATLGDNEWQTYDIKLTGSTATVHQNDQLILDAVDIEIENGGTGGHLDLSGKKGPLMLQGDHGPILYRNVRIKPL